MWNYNLGASFFFFLFFFLILLKADCLSVCQSVWVNVLICLTCLFICLPVCQSICGRIITTQGPKCLKAHEDLTNIGLWSLFLKVFLDWSCWQLMFCVDTHRVPIYLRKKPPKTAKKQVFPGDKEGKKASEKPKTHHKPDEVACLAVIW